MIINNPTKIDFETVAKENLTQAFNLLFKVYDDYSNYEDLTDEVTLEEIWEHHKGTLRTTLILLHQAIEGLMKASICDTSPLLLIDKPKKDWPTLPNSSNKDFDSLYTIGGESLLNTFCAVSSSVQINQELVDFIEEIRLKRNTAIHGTSVKDISPKFILINILKVFTFWFGKDSWHVELKNNLLQNPLFGFYDYDYEEAITYKYLDFTLAIIGKKNISNHISFSIRGRNYYCPSCKYTVDKEYGKLESKWAFLNPNTANSNIIRCLNCDESFPVLRTECENEGCQGNVLYNDVVNTGETLCLTCFEIQEEEQ